MAMQIAEIREQYPQYADKSDDELASALYKKYGQGMDRRDFDSQIGLSTIGKGHTAVQGLAQGATFGFSDEIGAGVRAGLGEFADKTLGATMYGMGIGTGGKSGQSFGERFSQYREGAEDERSFGERYEQALGSQRDAIERARRENPKTMFGTELAGGLSSGGAGAGRAVAGQTLRQAIPRLMGAGAGLGGLAGAGYSEANPFSNEEGSTTQFAKDVGFGAGAGAAFAPVLPAAFAGARGLGRAAMRLTGGGRNARARETGRLQVIDDLDADLKASGMTREQAEQVLQANPEMTIADLGKNLRDAAGYVSQSPGRASGQMNDFLEQRSRGEYDRIMPGLRSALDVEGKNFADQVDNLFAQTKANADALYEQAYSLPTQITPAMRQVLNTRSGQAAMRKAERMAAEEGRKFEPITGRMAKTEDMDYIIRAYDDQVTRLFKSDPKLGGIVKGNRETFKREVFQQNDALKKARATFSDDKMNEEALDLGTKVFRGDADVNARMIKDMSQSEVENFRVGVLRAVERSLGNKKDLASMSGDLRDKRKVREALRVAFGSDKKANDFIKTLSDEIKMHETFAKATTGSPTASRTAKNAQVQSRSRLGSILGLITAAKVGVQPFVGSGIGAQVGRGVGARGQERVASQMGDILRSNTLNTLTPQGGFGGGLLNTGAPQLPSQLGLGAMPALLGLKQ